MVQEQSARIAQLSLDNKRRAILEKTKGELKNNVVGLEKDLSRLKVERDMTMAEMEEIEAAKSFAFSFRSRL
jgi:Rho-type GTPase-activating protein 1/2